jgi:23S rRNA (uracil1939-C5)-methyltransferase
MGEPAQRAPWEIDMTGPFELEIGKLVYGGAGLGRYSGKVVFVPFSVPGDVLWVEPVEEKKNYIRARALKVLKAGPGRRRPECPHFGICGGCQWQHLEYSHQVETKRQILEETIRHHIPQTRELTIPMKASPQEYKYRSRARLQVRGFGTDARVGFFRSQSHEIEDIDECPLLRPTLNRGLHEIRETQLKCTGSPGLQQIEIACSEEEELWGWAEIQADLDESLSALAAADQQDEIVLKRRIGDFLYSLSPGVFFQANDFMIDRLVSSVLALAEVAGSGRAVDLYCGVGLFSLPLALRYDEVVSVEQSSVAARLCERNAEAACRLNIKVVCADVSAWMKSAGCLAPPACSLLLLDPPRTGAGPEVMGKILEWAPENIVYVSCDPQTLCRDLALLPSAEYNIDHIEGLDLFPQGFHFETIVRLRRR